MTTGVASTCMKNKEQGVSQNEKKQRSRYRIAAVVGLLAMVLLSACSYHPARIDPEPPVVIGDGDHGHGHGDGDFCPPGQAKKGNC